MGLLGGSWVALSRVLSMVTLLISPFRVPITLRAYNYSYEAPSRAWGSQQEQFRNPGRSRITSA